MENSFSLLPILVAMDTFHVIVLPGLTKTVSKYFAKSKMQVNF